MKLINIYLENTEENKSRVTTIIKKLKEEYNWNEPFEAPINLGAEEDDKIHIPINVDSSESVRIIEEEFRNQGITARVY